MKNYEDHAITIFVGGECIATLFAAIYSLKNDGYVFLYDGNGHLVMTTNQSYIYPGDLNKLVKVLF